MSPKTILLGVLAAGLLIAAEKYDGPVPAKPDTLYLLHASTLVETETALARQDTKKSDTFTIPGASSPARTPLSEPIFILDARNISPERMELYRLDIKNGNREVAISSSAGKRRGSKALHLTVTPLANHLYKVEAGEPLDNGQYAISPSDANRVFCFEIY